MTRLTPRGALLLEVARHVLAFAVVIGGGVALIALVDATAVRP